jgi:hypothetical protein
MLVGYHILASIITYYCHRHYGLLSLEYISIGYCRWLRLFTGVARGYYIVLLYEGQVASKYIFIYLFL